MDHDLCNSSTTVVLEMKNLYYKSNVNNFSSERTVLGMKTLQEILSDRESTAEVNSQNILSFLFDAVDLLFYG